MGDSIELLAPDTYQDRGTFHHERPVSSGTLQHAQASSTIQPYAPSAPHYGTQSRQPSYNLCQPISQGHGQTYQSFPNPMVPDQHYQWYTENPELHRSETLPQSLRFPATHFDAFAPFAPIPGSASGASDMSTSATTAEQLDGNYRDLGYPMSLAQVTSGLSQKPTQPGTLPLPANPNQYGAQTSQHSWSSHPSDPQALMGALTTKSSYTSPSTTFRRRRKQPITRPAPFATSSPVQSNRAQTSQESMTRRVAPRMKVRGAKDMSKLVAHLSPGQAEALVKAKRSIRVALDKRYVNRFQSKQEALDHLSRTTASLHYHQVPAPLRIEKDDIDSEDRLAILQHFLDAIREAPSQNELPDYFADDHEKHNYVRKNNEQYQQCLQKLSNLSDSSACAYLLLQTLIDVYDEHKGVPRSDLEPDLRTSRGKHKLEIDTTFYEKVAIIGDILKKYKWVGKDVLNNNNILLIVVATESYLRTKLNNCDSNATRQDWKDKEMKSKGVTKPESKGAKKSNSRDFNAAPVACQDESDTGLDTTASA